VAIQLVERATLSVLVADVGRAVRFYTEVLGFALRYRRGEDYAEVELPALTLALARRQDGAAPPGHAFPMSIALDVQRLDGAMLVLRERGVQFAPEIAEREGERIAFFTDVDGTPLFLRERR
jgi:catechol 2,3-dioxygenase-like lactoylglutathione lyase family enzyme